MNWIIELIVAFTAIGFMLARQAPRQLWAGITGAGLLWWSLVHAPATWLLVLAWSVFIPVAAVLLLSPLRRQLLIAPLLALYRKVLPEMSGTERESLEAGTVWWEAELFSGHPDWHKLLAYPAPALTPQEQAFIEGPVDKL